MASTTPGPCYGVPTEVYHSLRRFIDDGIRTGSFLHAVLCNDLTEAALRADSDNIEALGRIARYVWEAVPALARGNEEKVEAWIAKGGARGLGLP